MKYLIKNLFQTLISVIYSIFHIDYDNNSEEGGIFSGGHPSNVRIFLPDSL
jgi:hypothetical protein